MTEKKKLSKSNSRGMVLVTLVVLILLVALVSQSISLRKQNAQYVAQKAELEQKIKDEEVRAGEIANLSDYVDSKEYIEKLAREKLGLVYDDEILFKAEN